MQPEITRWGEYKGLGSRVIHISAIAKTSSHLLKHAELRDRGPQLAASRFRSDSQYKIRL
jgi:hypothetical protein